MLMFVVLMGGDHFPLLNVISPSYANLASHTENIVNGNGIGLIFIFK